MLVEHDGKNKEGIQFDIEERITTRGKYQQKLQHWFFGPTRYNQKKSDLVVTRLLIFFFRSQICYRGLRRGTVWRYLWLWWLNSWPESAAQLVGWKVRVVGP